MVRFVLVSYYEVSLTCKFELNTVILDFDRFQHVPETSNGAFCVGYAEGSLTFKFELNPASLDYGRFEVSKYPIFHNWSLRPQIVRFVTSTLRAG